MLMIWSGHTSSQLATLCPPLAEGAEEGRRPAGGLLQPSAAALTSHSPGTADLVLLLLVQHLAAASFAESEGIAPVPEHTVPDPVVAAAAAASSAEGIAAAAAAENLVEGIAVAADAAEAGIPAVDTVRPG